MYDATYITLPSWKYGGPAEEVLFDMVVVAVKVDTSHGHWLWRPLSFNIDADPKAMNRGVFCQSGSVRILPRFTGETIWHFMETF